MGTLMSPRFWVPFRDSKRYKKFSQNEDGSWRCDGSCWVRSELDMGVNDSNSLPPSATPTPPSSEGGSQEAAPTMPMRIFAGIMRKLYFSHPQACRHSSPAPSGHPPPGGGDGIHSAYRLCGRPMVAHPRPLSLPHGKEPPAAAICNRVTEKPSFL